MYGYPWASIPWAGNPAYTGLTWPTAGDSETCFVLSPADSDAATLACGLSATLSVTNLQTMAPAQKWRAPATSDYITVTFASPVAANALALVGHNFTANAIVRVRGFTTAANMAAQTSAVVDTNWQSAWPLGTKPAVTNWLNHTTILRWSNDTALTYWRVDIADGGAGITYTEVGRLALGRAWRPTIRLDLEFSIGHASADVQLISDWGATYGDARYAARIFDLKFSAQEWRDVMDSVADLQRLRGLARDMVVSIDPAATTDFHRFTMQGVFSNLSALNTIPGWGTTGQMWSFNLPLRELLF